MDPSTDATFENRLRKNARHLFKWAKRQGLTAFRVYDRDMPEWPFAVDWYDGRVLLLEYPRRRAIREGLADLQREQVVETVGRVLEVPPERIFTKTHLPKAWGREQYDRGAQRSERFVVTENGLKFWVNLGEYLDTGLFMDHRNTRVRVRDEAKGKRFLNLFAYTGAFTVYAAAGGAAQTTTVDLSNTYLTWAEDNLALNGLTSPKHQLERADATQWIREAASKKPRYDLVVLDPPSFSTSKKMSGSFNVQKDQVALLEDTAQLLAPGGTIYFSTNYLGFQLAEERMEALRFEELTPKSIPEDFHFREIHRCWRVTFKRASASTGR